MVPPGRRFQFQQGDGVSGQGEAERFLHKEQSLRGVPGGFGVQRLLFPYFLRTRSYSELGRESAGGFESDNSDWIAKG